MSVEDLCVAALVGDLERVQEILKEGKVDINKKDKDGNTALILASWNGHNEIVKSLLANGANINEKGEDGWTALISASQWEAALQLEFLVAF